MSVEPPYYTTIVVFGKEDNHSVASPNRFDEMLTSVTSFLEMGHCPLKCHGLVEGSTGKNLSPKAGTFNTKKATEWVTSVTGQHFSHIQIYDESWSSINFPNVFAAIHKMWGYGSSGYSERTSTGAENNITLAIRKDVLSECLNSLDAYLEHIVDIASGFYGFIEPSVQWDVLMSPYGVVRGRMIDMRWHDVGINDYRRGTYKMDDLVPRLYWANVFSRRHFKQGSPDGLPPQAVSQIENWGNELYYIRFAHDPQNDADFHKELQSYFNIVPPKT